MTVCPFCDYENIEGADVCQNCQQPLSDEYLQDPRTAVERGLLSDRVEALGPKDPITVTPDVAIGEVVRMMVDRSIGCVLVVQDNQIAGVFSERDAPLKLNTEFAQVRDRPVSEFMTSKVEKLDSRAKIAFAVQRMDLGSFRHVPIVDASGKPTGVVSARDILHYVTELCAESAQD